MKRKLVYGLLATSMLGAIVTGCGDKKVEDEPVDVVVGESDETTEGDVIDLEGTGDSVDVDVPATMPEEGEVDEEEIIAEEIETAVTATENVQKAVDIVKEQYDGVYLPNMPLDATMFESMFGLTSDMYEGFHAEVPMISAQIDTFVVVEPKEGMEDSVVEALESYRTYQVENAMQYPTNALKVPATKVYAKNGLVYYISLFGYETAVDAPEDEVVTQAEASVASVVAIIDAME